jgi:hypothetical protein
MECTKRLLQCEWQMVSSNEECISHVDVSFQNKEKSLSPKTINPKLLAALLSS